jgi:zinc transport system substrate-binding protein
VTAARGAILPCLAVLLAAAGPGCGEATPRAPAAQVAASIPPLAWFVDRLSGGELAVATLLPPGANPHAYEPTLAQLEATSRAVLWVRVGHPSFPFERGAFEALLADAAARVVDAADAAAQRGEDPHVWLSARAARGIAARVAGGLAERFPERAAGVAERAAGLDAELAALERELGERLAPFRGRAFFVYHPDWTAFAADHGLRQVALERGHKEPDAKALRELILEARREGARSIFVQPQFSRESAELVAREVGARVVAIDPLAYDLPATLRAMSEALAEALAR